MFNLAIKLNVWLPIVAGIQASNLYEMSLNALRALVAQHGLNKMEEAFQLLREEEAFKARCAAFDSQEQATEPIEPMVVSSTPRRRRAEAYELASEEELAHITQQIDEGHLRSATPSVVWNFGSKHHPRSAKPAELIDFIRSHGRSVTKEQLVDGLVGRWVWEPTTGSVGAPVLRHYICELKKQGIIKTRN
jgi:hypothetical protein